MLTAFFSDVHGNLPALEAALEDVRRRGADRVVCAGDLVGYGPFPEEVCRLLKKEGVPVVMGNYDRKVVEAIKKGPDAGMGMKPKKRQVLLWTAAHVGARAREYLARLPVRLDLRPAGGFRVLVVHGGPLSMEDEIFPSITGEGLHKKLKGERPDIFVCGHTHIPFVRRIGGTLVVNCGSLGQPVDGDPRPSYALVKTEGDGGSSGRIVRFDYDMGRLARGLEKNGLPEALRKDFAEGTKGRSKE